MYRARDGLVSPLLRPRVFFPYLFLSSRLGAFCNDFNVTVFDTTILLFQDNGIYIQSELMDGILPFLLEMDCSPLRSISTRIQLNEYSSIIPFSFFKLKIFPNFFTEIVYKLYTGEAILTNNNSNGIQTNRFLFSRTNYRSFQIRIALKINETTLKKKRRKKRNSLFHFLLALYLLINFERIIVRTHVFQTIV